MPLVLVALAIPLILGKAPPNHLYGFRTPKTLSSPAIWYSANRRAGINLLLAGLATLLCYVLLRGSEWSPERSIPVMLLALLGPLLIAIAASFAYLRRL